MVLGPFRKLWQFSGFILKYCSSAAGPLALDLSFCSLCHRSSLGSHLVSASILDNDAKLPSLSRGASSEPASLCTPAVLEGSVHGFDKQKWCSIYGLYHLNPPV
jgi:hypothetical protein